MHCKERAGSLSFYRRRLCRIFRCQPKTGLKQPKQLPSISTLACHRQMPCLLVDNVFRDSFPESRPLGFQGRMNSRLDQRCQNATTLTRTTAANLETVSSLLTAVGLREGFCQEGVEIDRLDSICSSEQGRIALSGLEGLLRVGMMTRAKSVCAHTADAADTRHCTYRGSGSARPSPPKYGGNA